MLYYQMRNFDKAIELGEKSVASGYVLKNATREEIIEAIKVVVSGEKYLSMEAASTMRENKNANIPVITRREKEVLQLIAEGMTNNEIAEKLFISSTTVDTHRKNLLSKFDTRNTASLIRLASQFQFIWYMCYLDIVGNGFWPKKM